MELKENWNCGSVLLKTRGFRQGKIEYLECKFIEMGTREAGSITFDGKVMDQISSDI